MSRLLLAVACAGLALGGPGTPRVPATGRATVWPITDVVAYSAPLGRSAVIVRPFVAPADPYAAGHRGVDLATFPGELVFAAAVGRARFAGAVAGRGVVVIEHADGVLTEYEPITPVVRAGVHVARGQPIGRVHGRHLTCGPRRCLHWSARREGTYFDPMTLLAPLGPVRLLPWSRLVPVR